MDGIYILHNGIYMLHYVREAEMENKVKLARVRANLTQQELADAVGITRQTVSLIEKGKYNPSLKLCLQICYVVNAKLDEIFWIEQEDFNEKDHR